MSPYAARSMAAGSGAGPSPAYRGTPSSMLGGRSPLAAGNLQLRGRAAKYAKIVKKLNAAGAAGGGGSAYNAVQDFAAACADESNGEEAGAAPGPAAPQMPCYIATVNA